MAIFLISRGGGVRSAVVALILQKETVTASFQHVVSNRPFHSGRRRSSAEASSSVKSPAVKPYDEIPGPKPLPLLGNLKSFLPYIGLQVGNLILTKKQLNSWIDVGITNCKWRQISQALEMVRTLKSLKDNFEKGMTVAKKIGELHGQDLNQLHQYIHKTYGPISKLKGLLGLKDVLFIYKPEDVEVVFRNDGPWPIRGSLYSVSHYRKVFRKDKFQGSGGVLVEEGSKWLEARSKANPPMLQPRISRRYVPPIGNVSQEFVDKMRTMRDEKKELPPYFINELFKWSLESIAYVALDTRLGCLAPSLPPNSETQTMIDAVSDFFEGLFHLERGLPLWKIIPTPTWKKFARSQDVFYDISVKYVEAAIKRSKQRNEQQEVKEEEKKKEESEPSVLERLLERSSAKEAAIMAQDMMLGGVDTTSYTVASALYLLAKNQDKQQFLFQELKQQLPRKGDEITEEMLESMKYLKACIKETLRFASPFKGNTRISSKEMVLSNYRVPAGVFLIMPSVISNTSEEVFPQCKTFLPERWLKSRPSETTFGSSDDFDIVSKAKKQPFAFIPFGFGPRSCIGRRFAELEIEVLLAKIIRNFCVEYNYGKMKYESKALYKPKDPLKFKLTDRNE